MVRNRWQGISVNSIPDGAEGDAGAGLNAKTNPRFEGSIPFLWYRGADHETWVGVGPNAHCRHAGGLKERLMNPKPSWRIIPSQE